MAEEKSKRIYTTEIINQIIDDYKNGYEYDTAPFKEGDVDLRAPNISFEYTPNELKEFQICMEDPEYFISKYCKFQTDLGRQTIHLREYQKEIIETVSAQHFDENVGEMVPDNKNVIIMASRQTGKCLTFNTKVENNNKKISIGKLYTDKGFYNKIKKIFYQIYSYFNNYNIKCFLGKIIEKIEKYQYSNNKIIENKFIEHKNININLNTDTGYKNATDIYITKPYKVYRIEFFSGKFIECADEHKFFDKNMKNIYAKNLKINDEIIGKKQNEKVKNIIIYPFKFCMYDITINDENHRYYTNDILSHNTTTTAAFMAHYLCFNVDKNCLVLANKDATAKEIVDKIIQIFKGLPYFLKPGALNFGKTGLNLDNGCRLLSSATTASTSIGFTIHRLYVDEFAHIPSNIIEPFWRSVYPTLSSSKISQCIISSTPNGTNMFYDIYSKSSLGTKKNSFAGIRIDYWQVPGHDDKWAEAMKADFGEEFFAQEFELQFNINSRMFIKGTDLQYMNKLQKEFIPKHIINANNFLMDNEKIKWHPNFDPNDIKPNDKFLFSVDLAEGDEDEEINDDNDKNDYNVINIFKIIPNSLANIKTKNLQQPIKTQDCIKLVQVGIYEDNEHDETYCANVTSSLLYNVFKSDLYDNVRIIVEINFQGKNYITNLQDSDLFYDDIVIKTYHTAFVPGEKRKKKFGFKTKSDKEQFCKKGAELLTKRRLIISDKKSISQLSCFGKIKGKLKGIASHDDISMTILNNIPRALDENTFIDWIEENILDNIKDEKFKYELNKLIKKWSMDNPELNDNAFNSLYINSPNNYDLYSQQNKKYQTYSQLLNK